MATNMMGSEASPDGCWFCDIYNSDIGLHSPSHLSSSLSNNKSEPSFSAFSLPQDAPAPHEIAQDISGDTLVELEFD